MRTNARRAARATLVLLAWPATGRAEGLYWSIRYGPSMPTGSTRDFVSSVTPFGAGTDGRYWFSKNFSVGVDGTWTRLYETSERATYPAGGTAAGVGIYRYAEIIALMPEVHAYFDTEGGVVPYVGLAAGISWVTFRVVVRDLDVSESRFGPMVSPNAGILIPFDRTETIMQAVMVGARYNFSAAAYGDARSTSFVAFEVGALVY